MNPFKWYSTTQKVWGWVFLSWVCVGGFIVGLKRIEAFKNYELYAAPFYFVLLLVQVLYTSMQPELRTTNLFQNGQGRAIQFFIYSLAMIMGGLPTYFAKLNGPAITCLFCLPVWGLAMENSISSEIDFNIASVTSTVTFSVAINVYHEFKTEAILCLVIVFGVTCAKYLLKPNSLSYPLIPIYKLEGENLPNRITITLDRVPDLEKKKEKEKEPNLVHFVTATQDIYTSDGAEFVYKVQPIDTRRREDTPSSSSGSSSSRERQKPIAYGLVQATNRSFCQGLRWSMRKHLRRIGRGG